MTATFSLDYNELINIDGIPKDNLTTKINIDDLTVDWDDELGSGSFAQVFRGWYLWTEVAVKKLVLPKQSQDMLLMKYFKREVVLLNLIKHPNIVQFLGWCQPEGSDYILLVEEFIKGGTLQHFIKKKSSSDMWDEKIVLSIDVAKALLYLHKNSIVYRDLKCENVLVDDPIKPRCAKLVDFGFARTMEMDNRIKGPPMTICGTDDWMAPEVILGMDYDERSDVFSFGVVLLECILGTDNVQTKLVRKPHTSFQLDVELARSLASPTCPAELLELTLSCCSYEPSARPDLKDILTILTNAHRRLNDSIAVFSDIDHSPNTSTIGVDLSRISPSDDESSSGAPSKNGSHESENPRSRSQSEASFPISPLMTSSPLASSPLSLSQSVPMADLHLMDEQILRSSIGSTGDDEADDLRRRMSQGLLFNMDVDTRPLRASSTGCDSRERADYIRVESMVDSFTVWNVRVGNGATVADVCENLGKRLDVKYKFIELYQINKKKKVPLFPEQFIDQIRSLWGDHQYKFGLMYKTSEGQAESGGSILKKWGSIGKGSSIKKDTLLIPSKKVSKDRRKSLAMSMSILTNSV